MVVDSVAPTRRIFSSGSKIAEDLLGETIPVPISGAGVKLSVEPLLNLNNAGGMNGFAPKVSAAPVAANSLPTPTSSTVLARSDTSPEILSPVLSSEMCLNVLLSSALTKLNRTPDPIWGEGVDANVAPPPTVNSTLVSSVLETTSPEPSNPNSEPEPG